MRAVMFAGVCAGAAVSLGTAMVTFDDERDPATITVIPATPQRLGDPAVGRRYLAYGDYIGSGIPIGLYRLLMLNEPAVEPAIIRDGVSGELSHDLNFFKASSGADVVGGVTCLGCHASMFDGRLVVGMGNSLADWTDPSFPVDAVAELGASMYAEGSPEREALDQFLRGVRVAQGEIRAPFRGVNPAFRLEEIAAAHRHPEDLTWSDERVYEPNGAWVASDVPAWWMLKKKHALYYTGLGRGDFTTGLQQINVVAIRDKDDAARHAESMDDLLAFLMTIEAPAYPGTIDAALADAGKAVFEAACASCHGTYSELGDGYDTYPNKLVPVSKVGTDPVYAESLASTPLFDWFNESWYADAGSGYGATKAEPALAYVAPPLDGVWCTAPYLHNGSVPTIEALLDSAKRPAMWKRSFRDDDYDLDRLGWRYEAVSEPDGDRVYDTTLPGYGAGGHTYGDDLSDEDRRALIEYLKTL